MRRIRIWHLCLIPALKRWILKAGNNQLINENVCLVGPNWNSSKFNTKTVTARFYTMIIYISYKRSIHVHISVTMKIRLDMKKNIITDNNINWKMFETLLRIKHHSVPNKPIIFFCQCNSCLIKINVSLLFYRILTLAGDDSTQRVVPCWCQNGTRRRLDFWAMFKCRYDMAALL